MRSLRFNQRSFMLDLDMTPSDLRFWFKKNNFKKNWKSSKFLKTEIPTSRFYCTSFFTVLRLRISILHKNITKRSIFARVTILWTLLSYLTILGEIVYLTQLVKVWYKQYMLYTFVITVKSTLKQQSPHRIFMIFESFWLVK